MTADWNIDLGSKENFKTCFDDFFGLEISIYVIKKLVKQFYKKLLNQLAG